MKKILALFIAFAIIFFSACSRESKFGAAEFASRMKKDFKREIEETALSLGRDKEGKEYFFVETPSALITLFPDANSNIQGISVMCEASGNIGKAIELYTEMCCVLTGSSEEAQVSTLTSCGITTDKIRFEDSSQINTVDKYKYVTVCNEYAVTLFCERV